MMLDIVRTIVACLIIAAAGTSPAASAALQRTTSPSEVLAVAAQRGKDLLAALREYTYFAELTINTVSQADTITGKYYFQNYDKYWFPAFTSAYDSIRVGQYSTRVTVNLRLTGYKKVSAKG